MKVSRLLPAPILLDAQHEQVRATTGRLNRPALHGSPAVLTRNMPMFDLPLVLSPLNPADLPAIDRLDARAFGPGRFVRSAYRLREGVDPDFALSFTARVGTLLVGANRMTSITCGGAPALLLGPLTVEPAFHNRGIGSALLARSLAAASANNHKFILLVGDLSYYQRFGFRQVANGSLVMPGPVDPSRLLYRELADGAFAGVSGTVAAGERKSPILS